MPLRRRFADMARLPRPDTLMPDVAIVAAEPPRRRCHATMAAYFHC